MNPQQRLVTLADGREVSSTSEEWRVQCLAKEVLRMPFEALGPWLADHAKAHGHQVTESVKASMIALHRASRSA